MSDTAISWSQATGKTWSFLWSVGQTPFGALSNSATLSFVQTDAALRNVMLSYLNSSMIHAAHLIGGFEMLAPNGHMEYVKRYLLPDQVGVGHTVAPGGHGIVVQSSVTAHDSGQACWKHPAWVSVLL